MIIRRHHRHKRKHVKPTMDPSSPSMDTQVASSVLTMSMSTAFIVIAEMSYTTMRRRSQAPTHQPTHQLMHRPRMIPSLMNLQRGLLMAVILRHMKVSKHTLEKDVSDQTVQILTSTRKQWIQLEALLCALVSVFMSKLFISTHRSIS